MQKKFSKIYGNVVTLNFTEAEALLMLAYISFKKDTFELEADQKFVQNLLNEMCRHFYNELNKENCFEDQMGFIMNKVHGGSKTGLRL